MSDAELTLEERTQRVIDACLDERSANAVEVFQSLASLPFVRMHGPEHHVLDGAAFLTAYRNAGGDVNLPIALAELRERGLRMPGAICGHWGVCGSAASVGAALSVLEGTGPLTDTSAWGSHMELASRILHAEGEIGGPRCCKRNAYVALQQATAYARERYGVAMESGAIACRDSQRNKQCLGAACPFHSA
ncbi:MAG: DUF5714 domain-containing protein [Eggerthellaceae bacterium]